MEFWGHEVKPGVTVACEAGEGFVNHLSQVALGETKKGSDSVIVFVKVGDKKIVIGTLSADMHPQILCDMIFDEAFVLSHNSKTTSVFLCGYKSVMPDMFESDSGEDEDEEMETEIPVKKNETEKSATKVPAKDAIKGKLDNANESDSETSSGTDGISDSDSEDDSISEDDSSDDETSSGTDGLSDDSEDDSEDEETPVPEAGKKRAAATLKTPSSDKKAKVSIPKKQTGDKKGVHVATPHPAKQTSKTPANSKQKAKAPKTSADSKPKEKAPKTPADSKAKEKSPKSGSHSCKSCSKTFNSAGVPESLQKAKKHEA